MPSITYTAPDGTKHELPLEKGQKASNVVADFEQSRGFADAPVTAQAIPQPERSLAQATFDDSLPELQSIDDPTPTRREKGFLDELGDVVSTAGDFAKGTFRDITGANVAERGERTVGEQALRGTGLGARTVLETGPKLASGVTDLASSVLNIIPAGLDIAGQALGDAPLTARFPTDATNQVDALFDELFPQPETFGERVVSEGGQFALTGGAGGAALAPKAAQVARNPQATGVLRNLGDEIGQFFSKSPKTFAATEAGGGAGAAIGADLSEQAELGPGGTLATTVGGGIAGGLAPQGAINVTRRAATGVGDFASQILSGEKRAAQRLQAASADPTADAARAVDAPEGVLPARATENPELQAIEARVLADDPALELQAARNLEEAEARSLDEVANQFGPTSTKAEFEQSVVQQVAPEGATIRSGEADDMVAQAGRAFDNAYDDVKGVTVENRVVDPDGNRLVPLRTAIDEAVSDANVLTTPAIRRRVTDRIAQRLEQLEANGTRTGGPDDAPIVQVTSDDLLSLRSALRTKQRALVRTGATNADAAEEAELLEAVIGVLTRTMDSQLPQTQATALRATDARYATFTTVQDAVVRSGVKGLTPEAVRAANNRRLTAGQIARGETGDLGQLAETGRSAAAVLGKPEEAGRAVRNMTPEQVQVFKADLNAAVMAKATPKSGANAGRLNGKNYKAQLEAQRETLLAAGVTQPELSNMQRVARELVLIQGKSPRAVETLLNDNLNIMLRATAAIAGSKSGSRLLKAFGGAGAGGSLILTRLGSQEMTKVMQRMTVDQADSVIRQALANPDGAEMAALLTRTDASAKSKTEAARTIQAWISQTEAVPGDANEDE